MTFDPQRYDQEVIKPLRRFHGQLPQGDSSERYAIEPGFTSADLPEHLKQVRRYWKRLALGGDDDGRARVARLLQEADAHISRTAGPAINDINWWRGQASHQPLSGDVLAPTATARTVPVLVVDSAPQRWQEEARQY